jgi:hypothetical protein
MPEKKKAARKPPSPPPDPNKRRCPGEAYDITPAVCAGRQKRNYEKCEDCPFKGPIPAPSTVLTGRRK